MPLVLPELKVGSVLTDLSLALVLKAKGKVKGECTVPGHEDEIAVASWSWGVGAAVDAVAGSTPNGRRSYRHLVVRKGLDASSTALMAAVATNDEVKSATLYLRKAADAQEDYFKLTLEKARVVSYDIECDAAGVPFERVAIAFQKVDAEYRIQLASGRMGAGFSFTDELGSA